MTQQDVQKLGKFLAYVLGRRPDEFGLTPDADGWVAVKDLLKALNEEEGWRHIRQASLNELVLTLPDTPVELEENRIRAVDRDQLPQIAPAPSPPSLLYSCVRSRAHAAADRDGLSPLGGLPHVLMSPDQKMALRIGERYDRSPVMVTIRSQDILAQGILLLQYGESLYLADYVPPDACDLPPLPKAKEDGAPGPKRKKKPDPPKAAHTPGSFFMQPLDPEEKRKEKREQRKKATERDKQRKLNRKEKHKDW